MHLRGQPRGLGKGRITDMTPLDDGRGEGYGRYQGLTIAEILELFDACVEEHNMRSISAVLRITREQLDARGHLGMYPVYAWIAAALTLGGLAGRYLLPVKYLEWTTKLAMGSSCVFVLLLISAVPTRKSRKGNMSQERAIREAAVKALSLILEYKPDLKPLTFEQETTVKILLKKSKNSEMLRLLL